MDEERNIISNPPKCTRVLMGSLVSSPSLLKNPEGQQGLYFAFPDLSIRTEGRYTLKFSLIKLTRYALYWSILDRSAVHNGLLTHGFNIAMILSPTPKPTLLLKSFQIPSPFILLKRFVRYQHDFTNKLVTKSINRQRICFACSSQE